MTAAGAIELDVIPGVEPDIVAAEARAAPVYASVTISLGDVTVDFDSVSTPVASEFVSVIGAV